ncbi:MAG: stage II sporulation protein M [Candidatus Diapherotrites archaeon]|nr:stage II sporulation protein M [Candidatus Diapherotrites archaeon]
MILDFFLLFLNNSYTGIFEIVTGLTFILPALIIFYNGLILGVGSDYFFKIAGYSALNIFIFLLALLPHAILEIPALIISSIFGTLIGLKFFFNKKIAPEKTRMQFFSELLKTFVIVILPIFLLAAFIEIFVSQQLSAAVNDLLK